MGFILAYWGCRLVNEGYMVYHMTSVSPVWEGNMVETLDIVTRENLKHDIEDYYRLLDRTLGCPLPPELNGLGMWGERRSHLTGRALPGHARHRRGSRHGTAVRGKQGPACTQAGV